MYRCLTFVASFAITASGGTAEAVDVVVVGAGYAGLSAARDLRAAGLSVRVFEANSRVGGRVMSYNLSEVGLGNDILELGGEWLNSRDDHPHAWQLIVDELGFDTIKFSLGAGDTMVYTTDQKEGVRVSGGSSLVHALGFRPSVEILWVWEELSRLKMMLPLNAERLDNMTFEFWLQQHGLSSIAHEVARVVFSLDEAYSEPSQYSALEAVKCFGGMVLIKDATTEASLVKGGFDAPARRMAGALGELLHLGTPVTAISQDDTGVVVRAQPTDGPGLEVHARRVLFSGTPQTSLKVKFTPDLSIERRKLYERMKMGNAVKLQLVYSRPFWREMGLSGNIVSFVDVDNSPSSCADNSMPGSDQGTLACMAQGNFGEELMRKTADQRAELMANFLAKSLGPEATRPIHYIDHDWAAEPYIGGACNPVFMRGALTQYGHLLTEDFRNVTWIGSDVSTPILGPQFGFVEGAIKSGREAATRFIKELDGVHVVMV